MRLDEKKCKPCEGKTPALGPAEVHELLKAVPLWEADPGMKAISRLFAQGSYLETLAFVAAVGWIAESEKHHPDMAVSYKKVKVSYSTHAVNGLSENDFICAAKLDKLLPP